MRAYARALVGSAKLSLSRKAGSRFLAVLAVSLALPLYRGRATGVRVRFSCSCALLAGWLCLFGAASLLQARVERPFFQWSCLLPCEWRRLLRVEASGDALRVARKSDSLRLRWVYRIRRDRSPIAPLFVVPRHTHTHTPFWRAVSPSLGIY